MLTLAIAFVLGCLCALGAFGVVMLARKPLGGARLPRPVRVVSCVASGMIGRQVTELWALARERGLAVGVVEMAHGTYGLEVSGSVYAKAPQAREAINRASKPLAC